MVEEEDKKLKSNGEVVTSETEKNQETLGLLQIDSRMGDQSDRDETLFAVLNRIFSEIFFPERDSSASATSLLQRIKISVCENSSAVRDASRNSVQSLIRWTRRGGPFRALLVISVGTILLLALTGLVVFMLFLLAATANAIIISLLMSLAAAGGFLALFFTCMTAIYIGALSVAVFVISTATITTMIAVLITTGWIGFFLTIWLATKKSFGLAKHSLRTTGSALSAYSSARHVHRQEMNKATN